MRVRLVAIVCAVMTPAVMHASRAVHDADPRVFSAWDKLGLGGIPLETSSKGRQSSRVGVLERPREQGRTGLRLIFERLRPAHMADEVAAGLKMLRERVKRGGGRSGVVALHRDDQVTATRKAVAKEFESLDLGEVSGQRAQDVRIQPQPEPAPHHDRGKGDETGGNRGAFHS